MAWRKWLVRGVVFSLFGLFGAAAYLYHCWTNPDAIRQAVIDHWAAETPGAVVTLESAYLRLLGGIAIRDLRLARRDDPDKLAFLHIPSAVLYHDKEQLIDGKFVIRKIEMYRPRLRMRRLADGRWNLSDIVAPPNLNRMLPTVVIQHGTIVMEDNQAAPGKDPLELRDVSMTLINDPITQGNFNGQARVEPAGLVRLKGNWQRRNNAFTLTLAAPEVNITSELVGRLSAQLPQLTEHVRQLSGKATLQASVTYQPDAPRPWSHDCRITLRDASLRHPQLPLPLEHLEASAHCRDGELRLEKLTASSGPARLELTGWARLAALESTPRRPALQTISSQSGDLAADADFEGHLSVQQLHVGPDLIARLPSKFRKIEIEYAPRGTINMTCDFARTRGEWTQKTVVRPDNVLCAFWKFPYVLERITGTIDHEIDTARHFDATNLELMGYAGTQPVHAKGVVNGEGPRPAVDLSIWADDLPIDRKLWAALSPAQQRLVKVDDPTKPAAPAPFVPGRADSVPAFHVAGKINLSVHVRRVAGAPELSNRYLLTFHHANVRYDVFPYPLEDVTGVLDIQENHWEFRDFQGTHKGGTFRASGASRRAPGGERISVDLTGGAVVLDSELAAALQPELFKCWQSFHPSGRMNFHATVDCAPDREPDVEVTIQPLGCAIQPDFFSYALTDLTGIVHYARREVRVERLKARHGATIMNIDLATAHVKPEGGYWVDLKFLHGSPIAVDDDLLRALPPVLAETCRTLHLRTPFTLKTRLIIDSGADEHKLPIIFWDGELAFRDGHIFAGISMDRISGKVACRGRCNGGQLDGVVGNLFIDEATLLKQPFRSIQSQFEVARAAPTTLILKGLRGQVYGGEVYGPVRIDFDSKLHYEMNLTASRIKLEDFSRQTLSPGAPISGLAAMQIYLTGEGGNLNNLRGRATVDVPNGRLYNLPVLLDLLKFLGLRLPDRTMFEEAHATCTITGERVSINRIELYGNAISVRGQGQMKLDGTGIDLEFYAVWARIMQLLPPIIKDLPPALSKHLLKIRMRGELGNVRCTKEPVPDLVEPLKELLQTLARRARMEPGQPASAASP